MLSVGLSLLLARCADCLWSERRKLADRLAVRPSGLPHRLLDLPVVSNLPEPSPGAEKTRRGNCRASFAHHRGTLAGDRSEERRVGKGCRTWCGTDHCKK